MVVAELENWEMKREAMTRKNQLKNRKLYINNNMTYKERQIQNAIRMIANEERQSGKTVKIGYRKLIINEQEFRWKEGESLKEGRKFLNRKKKLMHSLTRQGVHEQKKEARGRCSVHKNERGGSAGAPGMLLEYCRTNEQR